MKVLDEEVKEKWLSALRSGEYKQGTASLYSKSMDSYCCLGVLECVLGNTKENIEHYGMPFALSVRKSSRRIDEITPEMLWLGTEDYMNKTYSGILAEMNDTGKSFEEIAKWIEENM